MNRRPTYIAPKIQPRTRLVWNVTEIIATLLVGLVVAAITVMFILVAIADRPRELPPLDLRYGSDETSQVGTLPPCTDAIAEAGGQCQGPLTDDERMGSR